MRSTEVVVVIPRVGGAYQTEHAIEPPAKARFILAYLMKRGVGVTLLDHNLSAVSNEGLAGVVNGLKPYLVVVPVYGHTPSSSTQTMPAARAFAQAMKNLNPAIPILFSGTHPAALPKRTLHEEPIDYVCDGEGPITIHELLQALKAGGGFEKVRSLWYRLEEGIVQNLAAPLLNLSEEPAQPGWSHMDPRRYFAHDWHSYYRPRAQQAPYANPYSAEGCPFECGFCNIQSTYRAGERLTQIGDGLAPNSYRRLNPELFAAEVTFLAEVYGVRNFKIPDEMYMLHSGHILAIAKLIQARFGDSLNFWCYARVDTCKPHFLEPLRAAGFKWVCLGIEAANSGVRSGQDKDFTEDRIYGVVRQIEEAGMHGALNYIFGLPGDTPQSMQATLDLAIALNGAFANFYCAMALPGSALHREATASGYPLPERPDGPGWNGYAQFSAQTEPYYVGDALTPADILRFRDEAFLTYYSRPEYQAKLQGNPNFGADAVRTIQRMLFRPRLQRNLLSQ